MAFSGRGDGPSGGGHGHGGSPFGGHGGQGGHGGPGGHGRPGGGPIGDDIGFFNGEYGGPYFYYYIQYDPFYVLLEIIVTLIILIVAIVMFMSALKLDFVDPIEDIKKLYINTYLIILLVFSVLLLLINYLSKKESTAIKRLAILFVISMITLLVFFGVKINMDLTYTTERFEQFYTEQALEENTSLLQVASIQIVTEIINTGLDVDYYVEECVNAYNIFKIKVYVILALHLIFNILLIYQIAKVLKIQSKKEQLSKDDIVLFDEEQNVKY